MSPEEQEELRERLDKAGIPRIGKGKAKTKRGFHYFHHLSTEDYDRLLNKQNGRCAICKRKRILGIDHDHKTGKIRGLLCQTCNTFVGFIEKYPSLMPKIERYLRDGESI